MAGHNKQTITKAVIIRFLFALLLTSCAPAEDRGGGYQSQFRFSEDGAEAPVSICSYYKNSNIPFDCTETAISGIPSVSANQTSPDLYDIYIYTDNDFWPGNANNIDRGLVNYTRINFNLRTQRVQKKQKCTISVSEKDFLFYIKSNSMNEMYRSSISTEKCSI